MDGYIPLVCKGFQHQFWRSVKAGAPDLRMASLGSSENIDRAAGHTCQGDDGYGGLQQHQHLGASGKR